MKIETHELKLNAWKNLKKLRLQALKEFPNIFSETYSDAASKSNEYWIELANELVFPNSQRMFIAKADNLELGFVFALNDRKSKLIGRLGGMWVTKSAQKKGLGQQLCERVIEWGKTNNKEKIQLWVGQTNTNAIDFYQKNKFSLTDVKWESPTIPNLVLLEMEFEISKSEMFP